MTKIKKAFQNLIDREKEFDRAHANGFSINTIKDGLSKIKSARLTSEVIAKFISAGFVYLAPMVIGLILYVMADVFYVFMGGTIVTACLELSLFVSIVQAKLSGVITVIVKVKSYKYDNSFKGYVSRGEDKINPLIAGKDKAEAREKRNIIGYYVHILDNRTAGKTLLPVTNTNKPFDIGDTLRVVTTGEKEYLKGSADCKVFKEVYALELVQTGEA